jgi:hypothetical protein
MSVSTDAVLALLKRRSRRRTFHTKTSVVAITAARRLARPRPAINGAKVRSTQRIARLAAAISQRAKLRHALLLSQESQRRPNARRTGLPPRGARSALAAGIKARRARSLDSEALKHPHDQGRVAHNPERMKFGIRRPSFRKRLAARTSWKRVVRHNLGFKAPRGYGWLTNPRKAAYNRVYNGRRSAWVRAAR